MKRSSKKGFTLAELLIVVAILAILIAIMFPVFGAQLDKARAAADLANVRAKYSELVADAMLNSYTVEGNNGNATYSVEIDGSKLSEVCKYGSKVTCEAGKDGSEGKITVTYNDKIVNSFDIDEDVTFKATDTNTEGGSGSGSNSNP